MGRSSTRHNREVHGLDASWKGLTLTQKDGVAADPALVDVYGTFNTGDKIQVSANLDAGGWAVYSYTAVADGVAASTMATNLAAVINAVVGTTASASGGQITITPTTSAFLGLPKTF